jgi:hypothetical protein
MKANSIGIDVLAAAHGLLVAYYGRTELWMMREMKKVFMRRWGICSRFSELLAKPQLPGLQLQKQNVVGGVM